MRARSFFAPIEIDVLHAQLVHFFATFSVLLSMLLTATAFLIRHGRPSGRSREPHADAGLLRIYLQNSQLTISPSTVPERSVADIGQYGVQVRGTPQNDTTQLR
jgi:hypothetical protein